MVPSMPHRTSRSLTSEEMGEVLFLYAYALGATTLLLGGILEAVFASSWRDRAWHVGFGVVSGLLWPPSARWRGLEHHAIA